MVWLLSIENVHWVSLHADSNKNLYEEFPEIKLTEVIFSLASTPVIRIKGFLENIEEFCLKKSVEWRRGWKIWRTVVFLHFLGTWYLAEKIRFFFFFLKDLERLKLCRISGLYSKAKTFKFRSLNFTWQKTEGVKQQSIVVWSKRKIVLAN